MGVSQSAPADRHITSIEAQAWSEPVGYPVPQPLSAWRRVREGVGKIGTFGLAYLMMNEHAVRMWPFLLVASWFWMLGTIKRAQSRGAALDW